MEKFTAFGNINISKRYFILFNNNIFKTDNGWILEDHNISNFISFVPKVDIELISNNDISIINTKSVFITQLTFNSQRIREKINRSYIKVQDLFAKIGGIINTLFILFFIISRNYLNFNYYKYLMGIVIKIDRKVITEKNLIQKSNLLNTTTNPRKESREIADIEENQMNHNDRNSQIIPFKQLSRIKNHNSDVVKLKENFNDKQKIKNHEMENFDKALDFNYTTFIKNLLMCSSEKNKPYVSFKKMIVNSLSLESLIITTNSFKKVLELKELD